MADKEQAQWYVVHTYSGHENKVKSTIEKSIKNRNMEDKIFEVAVPMEEVVDIKDGKRKIRQRKIFPGYCIIKMIVTDESWYVVRNTKGVKGFVGPNSKPIPLSPAEVANMHLEDVEQQVAEMNFEVGDRITITEGPFVGFSGYISELHPERAMVTTKVLMFGDRETSLDIEVYQIKKQEDES